LVPSGRIGNPDLEAESGWNYEAGADLWAGKGWKFSSTIFVRNQEKLIDWINTPYSQMPRKDNLLPNGAYALSTNIWKVNTTGWEMDVQYRLWIAENHFADAQLGLLWLNNNGNEATPSLYLGTQANWITNFNVLYRYKKMAFSATGLYKKREAQKTNGGINASLTPEYFIVNGKIEYNPFKQLGIFVQVDNIGDISYSDLLGAPMPGRWWMGGVSLGF
jgi:iron complex outermembrane receptor protein